MLLFLFYYLKIHTVKINLLYWVIGAEILEMLSILEITCMSQAYLHELLTVSLRNILTLRERYGLCWFCSFFYTAEQDNSYA